VYPPKDHVIYDTQFGNNWRGPIEQMNVGLKRYEITNHLGNVLATITDKPMGIYSIATNGEVEYFEPSLASANDYYPFGMLMPSRSIKSEVYRSGFNGKEKDNEIKGVGNQQDYGMRTYDPHLGKFLSVDPLTKGYPWYTPYQFAGNKPIWAVDLDGKEEFFATDYFDANGALYKTVITLASDRGIQNNIHTVYRSSVYTNVSTGSNGQTNITFSKFYVGRNSAPNLGGNAFANGEEYQKALGRNQDGTLKLSSRSPFPIIVNGHPQTEVATSKTPGTLFNEKGDQRSPEARYITSTWYLDNILGLKSIQSPINPNDQGNTIIRDSNVIPNIYRGTAPLGSNNIPLKTNAVPQSAGYIDTETINAQGGDGDD